MPKQERQQHAKTEDKLQKTTMKCNPFDCVHKMNDGTTSLKHNHMKTRRQPKTYPWTNKEDNTTTTTT